MKGLKSMRFGLVGVLAAALVAAGAFLLVSQASAVSGTLTVGSATIAPGGQGSVDIRSNVPTPGLGAWTIDIAYDPAKVAVVSCAPQQGGVCNPAFEQNGGATDLVRITGASANGLIGDTSLGSITFRMLAATATACGSPAPLTATTSVFADATIGSPQPITVTISNGTGLACGTPAPVATGTPLPIIAPLGAGTDGGSYDLLILGLAGAGLAALAGYGALRLRNKAV